MNEMLEAMIALQREQLALGQRWLDAGRDMVKAQEQSVAAGKATGDAWGSWLRLWGVKP